MVGWEGNLSVKYRESYHIGNWACISYHVGGTSTFLNELLPKSNIIKDAYYYFISKENNSAIPVIKDINYNMIILNGYGTSKNVEGTSSLMRMSFVRKIDNKIDDDEVLGGKFRATCLRDNGNGKYYSYVEPTNKHTCHQFGLLLDF